MWGYLPLYMDLLLDCPGKAMPITAYYAEVIPVCICEVSSGGVVAMHWWRCLEVFLLSTQNVLVDSPVYSFS